MRALLKRQEVEPQALGLTQLVDEVVSLVRSDALGRRVQLETDLPADLPRVRGDRVRLQQVLLNLIVNGMEAMSQVPVGDRHLVMDGPVLS